MTQRPPISTRTATLFPTRRSSDLRDERHRAAPQPHRVQRKVRLPGFGLHHRGDRATAVQLQRAAGGLRHVRRAGREVAVRRSEEHTSELTVTNAHLVCRLLLEKKKYNSDHEEFHQQAYR